jgi:hypothetical protein
MVPADFWQRVLTALTFGWLLGEDVFISYSRADVTVYAEALAGDLAGANRSCVLALPPEARRPGTEDTSAPRRQDCPHTVGD